MKRKLLFAALCVVGALGTLKAQMTDVTSTYIANPSFELGTTGTPAASAESGAFDAPYSWTPTDMPTSGTHNFGNFKNDGKTPSNFGKEVSPSDGTYYYLARHSWASTLTTKLTQTSQASLPAGYYFLTVDYKIAKTSGDLNPKGYLSLSAKSGETTLGTLNSAISASQNNTYFNTAAWTTMRVPFYVSSAGSVDFVITFNFNPQAANVPQEAIIIDNVRLLKADYHATPIVSGTTDLYLYNEKEGQYLSGGMNWGTQAICDNYGQELTATLNNGLYSFATQQYNKNLGPDFYLDNGTAAKLLLLETAESSGKYYITQDGINYLTSNGAGAALLKDVTTPTDASVWTIVSKSDRKAALSSATVNNPVNATFLIGDANFSRACLSTPWTMEASNQNLSGGEDGNGGVGNHCAESYHSVFTLTQTLSSMPVGVYGLVAQGFYRQDGSDNEHLPYFYIADQKGTFPARTGSESSMIAASASFTAGSYTIDPIYYRLDAAGNITLGAKLETNTNLWCIFDNFQLYYYGDVSVAAVKMKASVDAYNAAMAEAEAFTESSMFASDWSTLQTAISDNTIDLNDPSLEESTLTTATANLVAANTAATAAVAGKTNYNTAVTTINGGINVDLTSLITNPGFELGNTNGWTNSGSIGAQAQGNSSFDNKQGSYYAERWHVSGTIDLNQTIAYLPAGVYKVEAYMYSDTGDAKLYANSEEASVSTSQKYHAVVTIADKGSIKIGGACTLTGSTWICMDDFKLTYLASSIAELPYTLASGKMGTDKSAAQTSAEAAFLADPSMTTYEALLSAIADAEASVANYAKLKTAIDKAEGVRDANNFVTAAATTALENEISTATTAWTDVTYTDAQCTSEIATLGSTVSGWHAIADGGVSGAYIASTWSKTHENWFDAPYINTWSTEGDNDGSGFSVPFFEWYVGDTENLPLNTTKTATLTGLDNGYYEVEIWARVQRRTDADFGNNNEITMSVNGGEAVSIMNGEAIDGGYYDGTHTMRIGRFTARGMVTDGTLTLSIATGGSGSNVHWLSWRDITYTKLDAANMTITNAQYATFVAPFDVEIPAEVEAYTVETATGATLNLTPVATTIPANTPVILYKETALAETPFYGKPVAGTPVAGLLTGVYAATPAPNGSYVLQNNDSKVGFYLVNTGVATPTVGANRCYLTVPAGVKANAFFFNEATGIQNVLENLQAGEIYDISGRKLGKLQKGVNIVNGKKVLVK